MANLYTTPPLKLTHFWGALPARNSKTPATRDLIHDKVGPGAFARDPFTGGFRLWVEGVSGVKVGSGAFDNRTVTLHYSASVLQGPWTATSIVSPVIEPARDDGTENGETTFGTVLWHGPTNRWAALGHVGNNSIARLIQLYWSTDVATGLVFERGSGNPVIGLGAAATFDDASVADPKAILKPGTSTLVCLYAGRAALGSLPTIGRATADLSDLSTWTKSGQVVGLSGAPAWRANGVSPAFLTYDKNLRLHLIAAGYNSSDVGSIGYLFSDDDGATWSESGITNPVISAGGVNDADREIGDVVQGIADGDVAFFTYGGANVDSYSGTGGSPLDAPVGAILPMADEAPIRTGKFYPATSPRSESAMTGTSLTTQTTSSVLVRFRAYRLSTTREFRHFYGEYGASFDKESYFRIEGGAGADAGKVVCFVRTPTNFASLVSASTVDDGRWYRMLYRRTGTAAHELWIDGVQVDSDTTDIGTDATVTAKYVGNNGDTAVNEPSLCTVSDVVTIVGNAVTWEQAEGIFATRTFPAGVSAAVDFPTSLGTDAGSPVKVEALSNDLNNRRVVANA